MERNINSLLSYTMQATNGLIGHIKDFVMDDSTWQIKSIVVDTHNWFGGKKVLVPVGTIKKIDWTVSKIFLDMTIAAVKKCKLFTEEDFIQLQLAKP